MAHPEQFVSFNRMSFIARLCVKRFVFILIG